jgi:hypothetical protein
VPTFPVPHFEYTHESILKVKMLLMKLESRHLYVDASSSLIPNGKITMRMI